MRIAEVQIPPIDSGKLAALSQFMLGRAQDTDAKKTISIQTFLNLAHSMGISLTADQLRTLIQQPPLNNLIANVVGDDATGTVVLRGAEAVTDTMTVDQARATVDSMAKRAAKKGL
jgi:esterase/lipase superfamily enzyme